MKTTIYIKLLLLLLALISIFHVCIILQFIPYNIAWGGRLSNESEMYQFETVSIGINLFLIAIVAIKGKYLKLRLSDKITNTILWIFLFIFILNTIGNLVAKTNFEKGFSILTLFLAFLIWKVLKIKAVNDK